MKRLTLVLSRVFDIEEATINDRTGPDNVENWDSFNALVLVSELEKTFKVRFTMKEVAATKCVKDVKEALKRHGVVLRED
jgi:acyl carrier protein